MKTFKNGWVLIARKADEGMPTSDVIIAMRPGDLMDRGEKYVVAHYNHDDDEWFWGSYFRTIEAAVTDYSER